MKLLGTPISTHWNSLTARQAGLLVAAGLALEVPARWIVRPDMSHLVPGSPWFNLPLRIAIEAAMSLALLGVALAGRMPLRSVGIPRRRWTRWEWWALAVVATGELAVVLCLTGPRWSRIRAESLIAKALLWGSGEFLFGFNQETGFRGLIMTGLLRLGGWKRAFALNTILFLIGPLHGVGLMDWLRTDPGPAAGYCAGVIACGLCFSWLRYRTDNVVLCAILHGIINGPMNGAGLVLRAHPAG